MIGFIKGKVIDATLNTVLLENGGIGYEIVVSNNTLVEVNKNKDAVRLYTYLNVREDGLFLFGFYKKEEKEMFLKLITVTGVGPKAAMAILSGIDLYELTVAILTSDVKTLSKTKGIGKKTAERIILELKGSLNADINDEEIISCGRLNNGIISEAVDAIKNLGITSYDAERAVSAAAKEVNTIEEIIALALKKLN